MSKILLDACTPETTEEIKQILGGDESILWEDYDEEKPINEFSLVILGKDENSLQKIRKMRSAAKFRNVPIILLKETEGAINEKPYIWAGATEILSFADSAAACGQILQGYLTPNRQPLEKEMAYLTPFIDATKRVFSTMANIEVDFDDVYFPKEMRIYGDVSGVIGLSGEAEGTVAVTFYWTLAQQIISQMLEVPEEEIGAEAIHDGVGELINMISGAAKTALAGTPYHFKLSLPTVVVGWGHEIGHPELASVAVLVFDAKDESFALQVALTPKPAEVSEPL